MEFSSNIMMKDEINTTMTTSSKLTALDRSIKVVVAEEQDDSLTNNNETTSRDDGIIISPAIRKLHKLHGTSLIYESCQLSNLNPSTFATSCTIFHRFYFQTSLQRYDAWSVAMAATLLASKVEEEPQTLKQIIHTYCHLYRKRILLVNNNNSNSFDGEQNSIFQHPSIAYLQASKEWSFLEKTEYLKQLPLPMKLGPVYKEWHSRITEMEAVLLRQLGFTLYWIPDSHPHKFILYFCRVLQLTDDDNGGGGNVFSQRAWNYCNDSCRLDLCLRYEPEVIASSAIWLAANDLDITLPVSPCPWWEVFIGKNKTQQLVNAANAILGLVTKSSASSSSQNQETEEEDIWLDSLVALCGFVKPLLPNNTGFNDVGSFLWDHQKDLIELKQPNT